MVQAVKVAATDWGMESLGNPVEHVSKPKISAGRKDSWKITERTNYWMHAQQYFGQ